MGANHPHFSCQIPQETSLIVGELVPVSLFCFVLFCFLGPDLQHMEVPSLGVESKLQLQACATATATWDLSQVCHLPVPQLKATPNP